ncbi:hypothetical protein HUJ04_006881 [Dendroctonus ponderosae]|uniref:RNA helicase n=1 Tax=Dendroctonus ponderosae TaxID=77166 RepID=A0AAR5PJN6_DENPD|nr:hypothetical protein HUJ04_006881 [Dendroctonus ponderosae]
MSARRNVGASWRNSGAPELQKQRKEHVRFGVNKGSASRNKLVIDEHIQEATPECLRIEIDKIFNEFLADPDKTEYIFPSEYNNLQRKYVHYKAQIMNLVSRSHGKEPNRQLHLLKKPKQLASQSVQVQICNEVYEELQEFDKKFSKIQTEPQTYRAIKRFEKVYGKIQDGEPVVPQRANNVHQGIETVRHSLPIFEKRNLVMDCINLNQVTIISSETGSGKTTQIPQYILEDAVSNNQPCKIICTQPRRISTIAAADRVAYERGETVGGSVGYHIRLESKCGYNTNLLFCTIGVFLRNLMCGNKCLKNLTHVIVDEIHERDKLSDFLLICLKQNLNQFPHLKVILMSATVNTVKFQEYFNSSAVLSIAGRLHDIQTYFLEDILSMTKYFTPQMRSAMVKLANKKSNSHSFTQQKNVRFSEQDQTNFNLTLDAYRNFSDDYNYTVHYDEATADLLQLFISEDVPVDQQHSLKGWTALMIACQLGDVEFVSKLCTLGASTDIADAMGRTAFDYAKDLNKNGVLQLLTTRQADKKTNECNTDDLQFLRQLYDMTTPDDFIDYELIVALIKYIHANSDTGSILVFLPGYDEIMQCNDCVMDSELAGIYRIFFLHSSMNMKDQCDIFKSLPNQRKLILSTNIAETSITVEDVVFVIDVGKAKEKVYDSYNKLSTLQTQWISRACAKQRQGRAGRVRTGFCFRLYSNQRFSHMPEERVPEILRVSLEELCLNAKIIAPKSMNIYNFLCLAPDPPSVNSVGVAVEHLQSLGALDKEEDLTRLGEYLAQLTLEPRLGKMLIFGCIFKCLEPMLTLCAVMAHKDPFQLPPQANLKTVAAAKRRELIDGVPSDHSVYLLVFHKWQSEVSRGRSKQFCSEYFISESTMYSVLETRRQLLGQLRAVGFVNDTHSIDNFNVNSNSWGLVKAIMSAAFFPNVAYPIQKGCSLATRNEKKVFIHNTSVCASKTYCDWFFFNEMVKNRINFMVRGVTACTSFMVAVMCGVSSIYPSSHSVNIDDWLEFYFGDNIIIKFRQALHSFIEKSILNPRHSYEKDNLISGTLRRIMDMDEVNAQFVQPKNVGQRPRFLYKVVHEASGPNRNVTFNRSDMRQRSAPDNFQRQDLNAKSIEDHKKGRTPKRYIPPHKKDVAVPKSAAQHLNFDSFGSSTSVSNIIPSMQILSLKSGTSNSAASLLNGLGPVAAIDRENSPSASNYQNGNGFSKYNYGGYQRRNHQSGYANLDSFNGSFNPDRNGYNQYSSGYGEQQTNSRDFELNGFNDAHCFTPRPDLAGRKIVKQQKLGDFECRDAFSLPSAETALEPDLLPFPSPNEQQLQPMNWNSNGYLELQLPPMNDAFQSTNSHFNATPGHNRLSANAMPFAMLPKKSIDYPDNPIFILIKANEKRNVDIAQSCKKWVLAPQTEKQVVKFASKEKIVYFVFFVKELQVIMGIAEFTNLYIGTSKPTAILAWKYMSPLPRHKIKHLVNPYNFDKPICDGLDGMVIRQDVGEELMRIYAEFEKLMFKNR